MRVRLISYKLKTMEDNIFRAVTALTLIAMIIFFILTFLKHILDHRLKNRIIDKGISDALADNLLKSNPKENKLITIKWFCLLAAAGVGLTIVYYTQPLDIHSLAIMAISISIAFLGYYFFLREAEK